MDDGGSVCRGSSSSMELLSVLFLCLLTCSTTTSAQQTNVPSVSRLVVNEDQQVVLLCSLGSSSITEQVFDWKNAHKAVFFYENGRHYNNGLVGQDPQFKGRVFHYPEQLASGNASILLRKAEVRDSGSYTCNFPSSQPARRATIQLIVGAVQRPIITVNRTSDGMLLQCEVGGSFPQPKVEWWDAAGNILPAEEPLVTKREDRYHVFLQTTVRESGFYRCVATQEEIHSQVYTETYVQLPASKPYVTILDQTKDQVLLQCEVEGVSAKAVVVWKDSSGNVVPAKERQETERGGNYDIILQTTVTKTDRYTCEASQEDIHLLSSAGIYVPVHVSDSSTGWIVAAVVGVVLFGVLLLFAVLLHTGHLKCIKGSKTSSRVQLPDEDPKEV